MRALLLVVAAMLGGAHGAGGVAPPDLFGGGKLVVYTPLGWTGEAAWRPRAGALRADAADLARIGFRAIVTDRAPPASKAICRFFKRHGFTSVIIGAAGCHPRAGGFVSRGAPPARRRGLDLSHRARRPVAWCAGAVR
jgi:hypothetical protein